MDNQEKSEESQGINMEIQGPFRNAKDITLASSSPRRQRLLASLGIHFHVISSNVREKKGIKDSKFEMVAIENAINKAKSVKEKVYNGVILAADTIVILENKILGKPRDEKEGLSMLKLLSGKVHDVITGCCLLDLDKDKENIFFVKSEVKIAKFEESILDAYVSTKEGLDKAGCYAVQGVGSFLVEWIKGSYTNVVGLPLKETVEALLKIGAIKIERR